MLAAQTRSTKHEAVFRLIKDRLRFFQTLRKTLFPNLPRRTCPGAIEWPVTLDDSEIARDSTDSCRWLVATTCWIRCCLPSCLMPRPLCLYLLYQAGGNRARAWKSFSRNPGTCP